MKKQSRIVKQIKHISSTISERVGRNFKLSLTITGASCVGNTAVGFGKILLGIISLSLFTCVSGFYTMGMVLAKYRAISGLYKSKTTAEQCKFYSQSGLILIFVSLIYVGYSVFLMFNPLTATYHMYIAIGIAAFTFTELALNIRGVIVERRSKSPLVHAIKMINLASSLICLVLTQTALLSFAESSSPSLYGQVNGIMGVIMGFCAVFIGIIMLFHISRIKRHGQINNV